MRKIAITAASGQLGRAVVEETVKLLGKYQVVAVARSPKKASDLGVEVRKGDYRHPEELISAFEDIHTVLLISSKDHPENRIIQHRNVIEAAESNGVSRLVYSSIVGKVDGTTFDDVIQSNRDTEELIRNTQMDWTVGRNGLYIGPDQEFVDFYLMYGKISNSAGDGKCMYTSRRELARAYAKILSNENNRGKTYNLGGECITQSKLAEIISKTYGKKVVYEPISVEQFEKERIESLGPFLGKIISGIYHNIRLGHFDVPSDFEDITGHKHQTVLEYFQEHVKNK
jgi:NAD(P)H dehydrogenase (quinone)